MSDIVTFLHNNQGIKIFDSNKNYIGTLCGFSDTIYPLTLIINPSSYTLKNNSCWNDSSLDPSDHLFFNNVSDRFYYFPFKHSFTESGQKLQNLYLKHSK